MGASNKEEPPVQDDLKSGGCGDNERNLDASADICLRCDFVAAVSNFSIQYNYACAGIATAVMLSHDDRTGKHVIPDFAEPQWAKDILLSLVFVGSVVGMLTMGYLGDLFGIQRALCLTNALTVFGALASALLSWGGAETIWEVIAVSRFVLGVGVGGNYPLSAAKSSEATPSTNRAVQKAASAFFWQGPGSCAPYLLGLLLLLLPSSRHRTGVQFRALLGAGALPSLAVLLAAVREPRTARSPRGGGELRQALAQPKHWWTLLGTAGTWFFFDVAFYGIVIFMPRILTHVYGKGQSLSALAYHASFMSVLGICGCLGGIMAVQYIGPRTLNNIGLTIGALLFTAFLLVYIYLPENHLMLFSLLCVLYFVMYFSANITTYLLPVVSFPREVRATFHGISAAAAKVGAMLGALLFPVIDNHWGTPSVMAIQASVCLAGAGICHFCVESKGLADEVAEDSAIEFGQAEAGGKPRVRGRGPPQYASVLS